MFVSDIGFDNSKPNEAKMIVGDDTMPVNVIMLSCNFGVYSWYPHSKLFIPYLKLTQQCNPEIIKSYEKFIEINITI